MLRPSLAPSRPSTSAQPRASHIPYGTAQSQRDKCLEKRKELEAVSALERASAHFLTHLESLAANTELSAEGAKAMGNVMAQWPNMFRLVSLFGQLLVSTFYQALNLL